MARATVCSSCDPQIPQRAILAGVFLTQHEMSALCKVYDPSGRDHVNYRQFLLDLNSELNSRRLQLVEKAFDKVASLQKANNQSAATSGETVSWETFHAVFAPEQAPDVRAGKSDAVTLEQHFKLCLGPCFDHSLWTEVFRDFSAAIPSDEYFVDFLENTFAVRETEADAVSLAARRRFDIFDVL